MTDIAVSPLPGPDDLPLTEGRPYQNEPFGQTLSGPSPGDLHPMTRLRALDAQRALLRPLAFLSRREAQALQELVVAPRVTSDAMVAALQQLLNTGENPPGSNCNAITQRCGIGCVAWCDEGWWTALFNAGFQSAGHIFVPGVQTDYWFGDAYVPDTMRHFQVANSFSKTPVAGAGEIHYWSGVNNPGDSHIAGWVKPYVGTGTHLNIESNHNNVCEYVKRRDDDPTIMGYCIPPFVQPSSPSWPYEVD